MADPRMIDRLRRPARFVHLANSFITDAERFAQDCVTSGRRVTALEFEQRVVLFYRQLSKVPTSVKNLDTYYSQYLKIYRRLPLADRERLNAAKRFATGVVDGDPATVVAACKALADAYLPGTALISAVDFYRRIFGLRADGLGRGALLRLFGQIVGAVNPQTARFLQQARSLLTGLEPETAGNNRKDLPVVLQHALNVARKVHQYGKQLSVLEFQRAALDLPEGASRSYVGGAYFRFRNQLNPGDRMQLDDAFATATGRSQVERSSRRDMSLFLKTAQELARAAGERGQPFTAVEFNRELMQSASFNPNTLAAEVSRYRARLDEKDKAAFDQARAVALGNGKAKENPSGGHVFAPDAGHLAGVAAQLARLGNEGFMIVSPLPVILATPIHPIAAEVLQLPGFVLSAIKISAILVYPASTIKWKQLAVPPSVKQLHQPESDFPEPAAVPLANDPVPTESDQPGVAQYESHRSWIEGLRISIPVPNQKTIVLTGAAVLVAGALMLLAAPIGI